MRRRRPRSSAQRPLARRDPRRPAGHVHARRHLSRPGWAATSRTTRRSPRRPMARPSRRAATAAAAVGRFRLGQRLGLGPGSRRSRRSRPTSIRASRRPARAAWAARTATPRTAPLRCCRTTMRLPPCSRTSRRSPACIDLDHAGELHVPHASAVRADAAAEPSERDVPRRQRSRLQAVPALDHQRREALAATDQRNDEQDRQRHAEQPRQGIAGLTRLEVPFGKLDEVVHMTLGFCSARASGSTVRTCHASSSLERARSAAGSAAGSRRAARTSCSSAGRA